MKLKYWKKHFHVILNDNSIVQHLIQIKNGIITNVNVFLKNIVCAMDGFTLDIFLLVAILLLIIVAIICYFINAKPNLIR